MRPRALIFIDWFSPGYKAGGPTTSNVNIVDHLSDTIDFWVITGDTDYHESKPYEGITSDVWIDKGNFHIYYLSKKKTSLKSLKKTIKVADCSTWYINGIYSKYFSIYPLILAKLLKPERLIVAPRGMLSPHTFTIKPKIKKAFLTIMNFVGLYKGIIIHGTNVEECNYAKEIIPTCKKCYAIENLPRKISVGFLKSNKESTIIRLVSFARISKEKNTLYAINALKDCKEQIIYDIYGQINSDEYWKECKSEISKLPSNVKVHYKGPVNPEMLHKLYADYDVMYLPSTGENFGHAILESFTNSRPVIISDKTPWLNLADKHIGYDISLEQKCKFSAIIDAMANMSCKDFNIYCKNAYKYARTVVENKEIKNQYIEMFV